jgi:hypothetical protein
MRRLRRNHQKQPTIDRLEAAPGALCVTAVLVPTSRLRAAPGPRRVAPGASYVTAASGPTSRLRTGPGKRGVASGAPRVTVALVPTSRFRAAPGSARVPWALVPASWCRTAPRVPRVPVAPGQMKPDEPSSSENRGPDEFLFLFFSTCHSAQGNSGGSVCPRGSGPNENRRADAEDLAEPGWCKATLIPSKRNREQGRRPTATE